MIVVVSSKASPEQQLSEETVWRSNSKLVCYFICSIKMSRWLISVEYLVELWCLLDETNKRVEGSSVGTKARKHSDNIDTNSYVHKSLLYFSRLSPSSQLWSSTNSYVRKSLELVLCLSHLLTRKLPHHEDSFPRELYNQPLCTYFDGMRCLCSIYATSAYQI